ncbi:MAG TPA: DinB family protein [Gemmatimonadaceae bacterium]|nr:DinB family protein [Gemmatimonadaceae bacterium]
MPITTTYSHNLSDPTIAGAAAAISGALADETRLRGMSDADASQPTVLGKWSRKEILGHLVDSAANNVQRFVRAQIPAHLTNGMLVTPGYEQDEWVRTAAYQSRTWEEIIELWIALNRHVVHIIENFDLASANVSTVIGDGQPKPIEHVIVDYAGHLIHHHRQILGQL